MFDDTHEEMNGFGYTGALGKQSARWAGQVYKLALVYAAIDGSTHIDTEHIAAARSAWAYNHRSASAFFAGLTGNEQADRLLQMWRTADYADLTMTDIDEMFSKHMSAHKRGAMLDRLQRDGIISKKQLPNANGGRPATVVSFNGLIPTNNSVTDW